jgi:hypothetical protein
MMPKVVFRQISTSTRVSRAPFRKEDSIWRRAAWTILTPMRPTTTNKATILVCLTLRSVTICRVRQELISLV